MLFLDFKLILFFVCFENLKKNQIEGLNDQINKLSNSNNKLNETLSKNEA